LRFKNKTLKKEEKKNKKKTDKNLL